MAILGVGSSITAIVLGRTTGRYEKGAKDKAVLHGRRHTWASRGLISGGIILSLILLPGFLRPTLVVFAFLWMLNGIGQALIAIPSSTLLAEHTVESERGRAYAAHFALTHFFWLLSYPAIGHASANWGAPRTFTAAGFVCLLVTVVAFILGHGTSKAHTHGARAQADEIRTSSASKAHYESKGAQFIIEAIARCPACSHDCRLGFL